MLLCSLLAVLPLLLAPLFAFLASIVPVLDVPVEVPAPVEVAAPAAPPALVALRAAVAARGITPLPPVTDELPVLRAPRGVGGRYVAPARCYAPAALAVPTVL